MEPADELTPEAAYRSYRLNYLGWLVLAVPLYIWREVVRVDQDPGLWAVSVWTIVVTLSVFAGSWVAFSLFAVRFVNRVKSEHPRAVVFVARRTKFLDSGLDQLTQNKGFDLSYLSAVVADSDHLTIVSRRGGKVSIGWSRVLEVRASVTRDFQNDYPCVRIGVRSDSNSVSLPLAASRSPWFVSMVTRPSVTRQLVAEVSQFERRGRQIEDVAPSE